MPVNPLLLESHPVYPDIETAAALIDSCWPAILASCSTFFYAALDSDHYRALVRSFQKFAQVAGLLRMATPRDAFLTTLGKAAVPAHVLAATFASPSSAVTQSPSLLRSATGLLNVDSLVNQASTLLPDRGRRASLDAVEGTLSSRNLLCLRALLNLAIALGPTLEGSWSIVFETLQQAEKIMASVNLRPMSSRDSKPGIQTPTQLQAEFEPAQSQVIASEVSAIQAAASRLFESSADFPNDSFVHLLRALCVFVDPRQALPTDSKSPPPTPGHQHRRVSSFSGMSTKFDTTEKDYVFALSKIRELVSPNIERFVTYPPAESGWDVFTSTVTMVATKANNHSTARLLASELLSRLTRDIVSFVGNAELEKQNEIQVRALSTILNVCIQLDEGFAEEPGAVDETSYEVHSFALETLRAIVEQTGDSLSDGWEIVFSIICTALSSRSRETANGLTREPGLKADALGRSAFGSVQLICSDFLTAVPEASLSTLIETIYRFAAQDGDLNMSLTATTLFWILSDLLYKRLNAAELNTFAATFTDNKWVPETSSPSKANLPALWISLLSRIRDIASDTREEVRTGAISTLVRIFANHGDELSSAAWQLVLRTIFLPLLRRDSDSYPGSSQGDVPELKARITTSKLMLQGVAKLLSTYLGKSICFATAQASHLPREYR